MAGSQPSATPAPHTITISYKNGQITANPPSITVDKRNNEHLVWIADSNFTFDVRFEKSPFGSNHYHSKSNASGQARSDANGRYKYSVEVDGKTLDPDVIVRP
jgi:hypothetical protein